MIIQEPKPCRRCGQHPDIVIKMPWYGKTGAKIECKCGAETPLFSINEVVFTDKSMSTPYTDNALIYGIISAVKEWNK